MMDSNRRAVVVFLLTPPWDDGVRLNLMDDRGVRKSCDTGVAAPNGVRGPGCCDVEAVNGVFPPSGSWEAANGVIPAD
jgi:hypothetical protein